MNRIIIAALAALAIYCPTEASAKKALLLRGIFGEIVAPMTDYEAPLKKKGYDVYYGSWMAPPNIKPDVVISHSRGADLAPSAYPKAKHFTIDGTWASQGCPKGTNCVDYYAPIDKLPFFLCCGGYPTRGASRTYKEQGTMSFFLFAPGHVSLPSRVKSKILTQIK